MAATWRILETTGRLEALDPSIWFQHPRTASGVAETIEIAGEDGEPKPGEVRVTIVSITPALPPSVTLLLSSEVRAPLVKVEFTAASMLALTGADVPIIELSHQWQRGGPLVPVPEFSAIPAGAAEVVRYHAETTYLPAYTITLRVEDWAANYGVLLGVETRTYRFGLLKDYSINRDRLVAAVNARR